MKCLYKFYMIMFLLVCYVANLILMFFSNPIHILIANLIILAFMLICPLIVLLIDFLIDGGE